MSLTTKVDEASKVPEAVDIRADTTLAMTTPNRPAGKVTIAILVNAFWGSPKSGRIIKAHIPMILIAIA
jgi:hypothetical protein